MVWGRKKHDQNPSEELEPVTREKLPTKLQRRVNRDDDFYDDLYSP
jgi:fission process protein 1